VLIAGSILGLGSYWNEIIEILREIIPVYDKVNSAISLGKDTEYRERGIRGKIKENNLVLDAGSGYGNMSKVALRQCNNNLNIIMLDPILEMLAKAKTEFNGRVPLVSGIFEHLPFKDNAFDAVMCGYSFRDAISIRTTIAEFSRILRDGGRLIIVDIGKPDNAFNRFGVSFYLKFILGMLAFFAAGTLGLKFRAIYGTYKRLPKNAELDKMLKEKFKRVEFETEMSGGAVLIAAYK
jgi:demethylmenaquinone methyltransferase/2-methoxy-6-polyprenyl-1,4-benzoquinol methylase